MTIDGYFEISGGNVACENLLVRGTLTAPSFSGGGGGGTTTTAVNITASLTNGNAGTSVPGASVYCDAAGSFKHARSNASGTSTAVGLLSASTAAAAAGAVVVAGPLTLTTAEWDAVTGASGGLTATALYWVDPTTAGKLTSVAPTTVGQFAAFVGLALSTTVMLVRPQIPVAL